MRNVEAAGRLHALREAERDLVAVEAAYARACADLAASQAVSVQWGRGSDEGARTRAFQFDCHRKRLRRVVELLRQGLSDGDLG